MSKYIALDWYGQGHKCQWVSKNEGMWGYILDKKDLLEKVICNIIGFLSWAEHQWLNMLSRNYAFTVYHKSVDFFVLNQADTQLYSHTIYDTVKPLV